MGEQVARAQGLGFVLHFILNTRQACCPHIADAARPRLQLLVTTPPCHRHLLATAHLTPVTATSCYVKPCHHNSRDPCLYHPLSQPSLITTTPVTAAPLQPPLITTNRMTPVSALPLNTGGCMGPCGVS